MQETRSNFYELGRFIRRFILPTSLKSGAATTTVKPPPHEPLSVPASTPHSSYPALNKATALSTPVPSPNSSDRNRLLTALKSGAPVVLLHGRAGTGKTSLIRSLKDEDLRYVVVAPTGIAAVNAGGQTIHSFFAIPPWIVNLKTIKPRKRLGAILRRIDFIIIDEVSMVRADLLDVIDSTLKVQMESDEPFGGKTILLVGDFLQLPPVVERQDAEILQARGYEFTHAFGAKCIQNLRRLNLIELSTVYRHSDPEFLKLLDNVRTGDNLEETVRQLNLRCLGPHRSASKPVILTSRTDDASEYNRQGLAALPGNSIRFIGVIDKKFQADRLPAPEHLDLKKGARIILVKNDPEKRWVNGSLGTVSNLSSTAVWVQLDKSSGEYEVHRATWESIVYQRDPITQDVIPVVVGTYTQFPIAPAWAMTIHKAQGLTLDDVRIDLGQGAFSPGQTYVALSRARSLDGLSFSRPLKIADVMADTSLVHGVRHFATSGRAAP